MICYCVTGICVVKSVRMEEIAIKINKNNISTQQQNRVKIKCQEDETELSFNFSCCMCLIALTKLHNLYLLYVSSVISYFKIYFDNNRWKLDFSTLFFTLNFVKEIVK